MKADKIHISHFHFLTLESLEIDRMAGEHATAAVCGTIRDGDVEEYRNLVTEKIWVHITAEDENGGRKILMTGMIAGFSLEKQPHVSVLKLVLKSGTYLMDGAVHFRSFQNGEMGYLDVLKAVNRTYGDNGVIAEDSLEKDQT